ncbi:O-methyltransferase lcsG [Cladobotryum mycophilum]|uniref:O-methyltransferase lcsG n=1 Tax=Cladobotryum mycophilum TaxID=491253 RepID=A0ABR0SGW7_9HYPO
MADSQPTLSSLAAKITELSNDFTTFLTENKIPQPTFAADSPTSYNGLTAESFVLRQRLLDSLMDMWYLVQGPSESVFNFAHTVMPDTAALNILNHFDFWSAVPLDGTASYADIAKHTSLPEEVVQRVLEHAVTLRIFSEKEPKQSPTLIEHTSRSAALAKSAGLRALVSAIVDDSGAPMMVMTEALRKYSYGKPNLSPEMSETAFALLRSGGGLGKYANSWDLIENDGEGERKGWRQRSFVDFMSYLREIFRYEEIIERAYDWEAAGDINVVDLGGSAGHDSFALARKHPNLTITIQDLAEVQPVFEKIRPAEVESQVSFMVHDFFQPQTVSADVYLIKVILHDWPDKEAIKILRGLVPALRPGARVLFIDYVGKQSEAEETPLPRSIKQMGTATDLRMMALFNGKERPVEAWKEIFRAADERFEIARVEANPLTFFVVMEAVWRG